MFDDQLHRQTLHALQAASYQQDQWQIAIDLVARATGSKWGELLGWFSPDRPPMHLITKDSSESAARLALWGEIGGADPGINPMINAGMRARPFETLLDTDLISRDARREHILWNEVFDPSDIPHLGSTLLHKDDASHLVLGVLRSRKQGPLLGEQRRMFEFYARAASVSAEFGRKLGEDCGKLIGGALDVIGTAAIAVNRYGRVVGITEKAEQIVLDGCLLSMRKRTLRCRTSLDTVRLEQAMSRTHATRSNETLEIRVSEQALRISVLPLGDQMDIGYQASLLLILEDVSELRLLTPAEKQVYELLVKGYTTDQIADHRGVSRETARTQSKSVYSKLGAEGQLDLIKRRSR